MKGTILYVGNFELPDLGASANRVVSNGKLFEKLGYRVVCLGVKKDVTGEGVHCLDEARHMYEQAYPCSMRQWVSHIYSTKNIETLVAKYPDVCMVILYNAPYSLVSRVRRVMRNRNIKVVYDCTEWTVDTEGSWIKRKIKQLDSYAIRHALSRVTDGIIVVSTRMQKAYATKGKVLLLPPLIDISDEIWQQEPPMEQNVYTFCFAGGLDGKKESLDVIVEAAGTLPKGEAVVQIIGPTKEAFCSFYPNGEALLQKAGEQICFLGRLSHHETIRYVSHCDCNIFIRENNLRNQAGFPTKFVEAYTCGVRIITTDVSDVGVYADNRVTVLKNMSVSEVAKAMSEAAQEKKKQKELCSTFHYETYEACCKEWLETI